MSKTHEPIQPRPPLRYTIKQATERLNISRSKLYQRIAAGLINIIKDGKRTFILADELDRYGSGSHGG